MINKISSALISVFDKKGILPFVNFLYKKNVKIISTGGTAKFLKKNGIKIFKVNDLTNFPEILDGRVKTLHPNVFGGILFRRDNKKDLEEVSKNKISPIDLVLVNLYPFDKVSAKDFTKKIEMIDIGGPSILRAAAKNFQFTTVLSEKSDFKLVKKEIDKFGNTSLETRQNLAAKVFSQTTKYDAKIAKFFDKGFFAAFGNNGKELRYGENPHQKAKFFSEKESIKFEKLHGKEMSYCNFLDTDAAIGLGSEFIDQNFCAIFKHANPCGAAIGKNIREAFLKAHNADPISAFGGIIVLSKKCDIKTAKEIVKAGFFEIILALDFDKVALEVLKKKKNLRVLKIKKFKIPKKNFRKTNLGILEQDADQSVISSKDLKYINSDKINQKEKVELDFAWKICKYLKSNAIVLVKDGVTVGLGIGQTSRVNSMKIAISFAGKNAKNAVCASDAFFPFPDAIEIAAKAGIKTIIQPGGSIRDNDVFKKAKEMNIKMCLTATRVFRH